MPAPELVKAFLSHAKASGGRSTALQPLGWLTGMLTLGLVLAPASNSPHWLLLALGAMLVSSVLLYLGVYVYFVVKDPDALRSERFTLSKMALEKNLMGDSTTGLLEVDESERLEGESNLSEPREGDTR